MNIYLLYLLHYITEDKYLVLRQTSAGRKRKLSNYRSKLQIKKQATNEPKRITNSEVIPNYHKLSTEEIDIDVEVVHTDSFIEQEDKLDKGDEISYEFNEEVEFNEVNDNVEDINSEENVNESSKSFKEYCISKLTDKTLMSRLVDRMEDSGNLYDFMKLIEMLSSGEFPADNIVLLLLLDRVRFQNCSNTTAMRYRDVTRLFWSIVYRLCKGVGITFFGGEKNWGQVVSKECEKSKYPPEKSKLNFAVPDKKILREISQKLPKVIPPGKIECTLEMLRGKQDLIVLADGKLVTKGLKSNFCGDVDLFGHEDSPNLEKLRNYLEKQIDFICKTVENYSESSMEDKFTVISELIDMLTEMIENVRKFNNSERKKLLKFTSGNYPSNPDRAISACKTHIYTSSIWIRKAVNINFKLFRFLSNFQNNMHTFGENTEIELTQCSNIRLLHDSQYVSSERNKNDYPHLIRKYSDDWKELVKESLVTDNTVSDSLGLNGTRAMKKYYKNYIMDEGDDEYLNQKAKPQYEIDCIATLCCVFIPAVLPSCALLYEEGCSFHSGKVHLKLLSSSPGGIIR